MVLSDRSKPGGLVFNDITTSLNVNAHCFFFFACHVVMLLTFSNLCEGESVSVEGVLLCDGEAPDSEAVGVFGCDCSDNK